MTTTAPNNNSNTHKAKLHETQGEIEMQGELHWQSELPALRTKTTYVTSFTP